MLLRPGDPEVGLDGHTNVSDLFDRSGRIGVFGAHGRVRVCCALHPTAVGGRLSLRGPDATEKGGNHTAA